MPAADLDTLPEPDAARWDAAVAGIEAARAHHERGELGAGEAAGQAALTALLALLGPDHPDTANARDTLAAVWYAQGRVAAALAGWAEAVRVLETYAGVPEVDPMRRDALRNFGYCLAQSGRFDEALRCLDTSLALFEADPTARHRAAMVHNFRGVALKLAGRYEEAEIAYLASIAAYEAIGHAVSVVILHNLSGLATARGDHAAGETWARRAITEESPDASGLDLGTHYCGLADALAGQGRLPEAVSAYERGLALFGASAPDHVEVAYALHNLGDALSDLDPARAERCYREALRRKEAAGAAEHERAATLANLAVLLAERRRAAEARVLVRRAIALVRGLPARHPVRVGCEAIRAQLGR